MPVVGRRAWVRRPPPKTLAEDAEVWVIRFTGEVFTDYMEYVERLEQYRIRQWTDPISGRNGLTLEEALLSEEAAVEVANTFPESHRGCVLEFVQFSTRRVPELVTEISNAYRDCFVPGEEGVYLPKSIKSSKKDAPEVEVLADVGSGRYEVRVKGEEQTQVVTAAQLYRPRIPFTQYELKLFIRESTTRANYPDSPLLVKDELVAKYNIDKTFPEHLRQAREAYEAQQRELAERREMKRQMAEAMKEARRLAKLEKKAMTEEQREALKAARLEARKRKAELQADENGKPAKKPAVRIKYPIEDKDLKKSDRADEGPRPMPSNDFLVPASHVSDAIGVWDFLITFRTELRLSPFTFRAFQQAITHEGKEACPLLAHVMAALLNFLCDPINKLAEDDEDGEFIPVAIDDFDDTLRPKLKFLDKLEEEEKLPPLVTAFLESDARFVDAAVETKLAVLDCMISACFHSQAHRDSIDAAIERLWALKKDRRELRGAFNKRKKKEAQEEKEKASKAEEEKENANKTGDGDGSADGAVSPGGSAADEPAP